MDFSEEQEMIYCQQIFNIFGLFLDLIGVLALTVYGKKTLGITSGFEEAYVGAKPWYYVGISCIIIGFVSQIIGNIISFFL